jgi:hypothetical protein
MRDGTCVLEIVNVIIEQILHCLYLSPNIVTMTESRKLRWVGQMGEIWIQNFNR